MTVIIHWNRTWRSPTDFNPLSICRQKSIDEGAELTVDGRLDEEVWLEAKWLASWTKGVVYHGTMGQGGSQICIYRSSM
jgi:hypothetical protein